MTGPEEIAEVFGIFHDGSIAGGTTVDHAVELVVEIEYLARRIRPTDRRFLVRIDGLEQVSFTPWSDDGRTVVPAITGFVGIASLGLGALRRRDRRLRSPALKAATVSAIAEDSLRSKRDDAGFSMSRAVNGAWRSCGR